MNKFLAEINDLFDPEDRRFWPVLMACAIVEGLARGLVLTCANEAAAVLAKGQPFLHYALAMAALLAVAVGLGHFTSMRAQFVSSRLAIRLRHRLVAGLRTADLRLIERVGVDKLHWHIIGNVNDLAFSYEVLIHFASAVVMLALSFAYVGWLSMWGLALAVGMTIVGLAVNAHQERLNLAAKRQWTREWGGVWGRYRELLEGYKELRLSNAKSEDFLARIERAQQSLLRIELAEKRHSSLGSLSAYTFQTVLIGLVIFGLPVFNGLDGVTALRLLAAMLTIVAPLEAVVAQFPGLVRTSVALENLREIESWIRASAARHPPGPDGAHEAGEYRGIELQAVTFSFAEPHDPDAFFLGPVDLHLSPGEVVFVTGGNGSGKSVLLRLLTGLYRPLGGQILLNGAPVDDARYQEYREHFATVFHDFHLFTELLGRPAVSAAEIEALLQQFDLQGRTAVADGAFTTVALSTGQRKRLALLVSWIDARAVLVLDEFGAELDPLNRRRFYDEWLPALKAAGKTVVVATHDDAYFDRCDLLIKMDFGKIVAATRMARRG